jgi:transglutaminase superfamily protein
MSRLVKFWRLSRRDKKSLCEAAILLSLANVCVRTISFKHIDRFLRTHWKDRTQGNIDRKQEIALVQRSISRAANTLPSTSRCLGQSIAEFIMLRRRGIRAVLCAGVRSGRSSLVAHAWVETVSASSDSGYATVIRIGTENIGQAIVSERPSIKIAK